MPQEARQDLTPKRIVEELDRYIVGQMDAKKAVAIAIRNRLRRQKLGPVAGRDILPKNLILMGPTGVGKTEIARRLAGLVGAPFLKVEATKFTEVGYVGRDVESMVRDLVEASMNLVRAEQAREVEDAARARVEERLLDALEAESETGAGDLEREGGPEGAPEPAARQTRGELLMLLRAGRLEGRRIEVALEERSGGGMDVFGPQGVEQLGFDFQSLMERIAPPRRRARRVSVAEARRALAADESERLLDKDTITREGLRRAENEGIIFLDEIDKICLPQGSQGAGPDVSRGGVQRDLLPIVEGSTVSTRYGPVRTDHVLFIAAGAFHVSKPTDLIPELQGRFPIRVVLSPLGREDLLRILREPENALVKQYAALLSADGVTLEFDDEALIEIARIAEDVNERTQNIGARRLHTLFEKLLEDVLFRAPDDLKGRVLVDQAFVTRKLARIASGEGGGRYVI